MEFTSEEEIALIKSQLLRRSIGVMEGCNRASNVGEVRRVNIVYYLSVNGTIQQPHLIRVRIQHNGVRLRDVKRWLSDLRGKDMPDSFSWSYKRQYKIGYVWQDLMDDDLITPICDNEYVLMGSQLPSSSPYPFSIIDTSSCGEKTPSHDLNFVPSTESDQKHPTKTPPPPLVGPHQVETDEETTRKSQSPDDGRRSSVEAPRSVSPQNEESFVEDGRSKGSRRASRGVRAILACGMVECNGTPLLPVRRRGRGHHGIITRILPLCFRRTGNL